MISGLVLIALLVPLTARAELTISVTAEKETKVVRNGKTEVKLTRTKSFAPGDTIIYTIAYRNAGAEPATNAVIDDPVPRGTSYLDGSATGAGAEITYSIDGGKTYKKPMLLSYDMKRPNGQVEKRQAKPEEYTHIRWTISQVPAGGSGEVGFRTRVK
jgi:uncharacterized repeat protein (TIGR01451 family)